MSFPLAGRTVGIFVACDYDPSSFCFNVIIRFTYHSTINWPWRTSSTENQQQQVARLYAGMSDRELQLLAREAWSLTEIGKRALSLELKHRGLEVELTRSAVAPDDLEMRYLSSLLSRRDRIALLVATGLGIGFGYLTGLGGLVFGFPYTFLIIPCVVVIFADQRKLLVWQVCVFSYPAIPPSQRLTMTSDCEEVRPCG